MIVTDEDDCSVCGDCPKADRKGMRDLIDVIPAHEPICEACVMAWAINIGLVVEEPRTRGPPK